MNGELGWNTWDVRCLNGVMTVPDMAEVRVSIYDTKSHFFQDEFLWKNVRRFGYHDLRGGYFDIDFHYGDFVFNMQFAAEGKRFVWRVTPLTQAEHVRFFVSGLFRWNGVGSIIPSSDSVTLVGKSGEYRVDLIGSADTETPVNVSHSGFLFESGRPIYLRCNNSMQPEEMDRYLEESARRYEEDTLQGGGNLEDAPQAVIKGIVWNTVYEPTKRLACTPVSRAWCTENGKGFGSYVLFCWDTFFASLMSGMADRDLAYSQIDSIIGEMTKDGMVPNFGAQNCASEDRSQPPVGAYCLLKLYRQHPDNAELAKQFDRLYRWNRWWKPRRDGNGDGLLEWGSDPFAMGETNGYHAHDMQAAMYESGLDNSPMYDGVVYNETTNTMELADVGLNALYALDCEALAGIASILGRTREEQELRKEYSGMKERINRLLWNEQAGIYCNRYWDGSFSPRLSPTNFYPMIAGIASPEQVKRMVEEHLLNEKEFWGRFVIPSISKNDPAFGDNDYWRGRIWAPMNFLVSEGLKRCGLYDVSYAFSKKSLELFLGEWREESHIHENYNAITGDGDDVTNADPVYHWGGLLAYTAVGELIEFSPWGSIRFGNLSEENGAVHRYHAQGGVYDVVKENGLKVLRNGKSMLESDVPFLITAERIGEVLSLSVISRQRGSVLVSLPEESGRVNIRINGKEQEWNPNGEKVRLPL